MAIGPFVGCALLLVPGVYLLDNVNVVVDLYVGTIIRATVPMLYNGTMTLVVFGLAVAWLCLLYTSDAADE